MPPDIPEADEAWFKKARLMERFICTPDHPWTPEVSGAGLMVLHPDARPTDYVELNADTGQSFHVERYCPNCKYEWKREP